jgi:hypothetical protein
MINDLKAGFPIWIIYTTQIGKLLELTLDIVPQKRQNFYQRQDITDNKKFFFMQPRLCQMACKRGK